MTEQRAKPKKKPIMGILPELPYAENEVWGTASGKGAEGQGQMRWSKWIGSLPVDAEYEKMTKKILEKEGKQNANEGKQPMSAPKPKKRIIPVFILDEKKEVKQEVKQEVKSEVKKGLAKKVQEVKSEVKQGVTKKVQEVKTELKKKVKEVKQEVKKEVKQEVKKEVKREVKKEVKQEVKKEVKQEVKKEVKQEVKKELKRNYEQLMAEIGKKVEKNLGRQGPILGGKELTIPQVSALRKWARVFITKPHALTPIYQSFASGKPRAKESKVQPKPKPVLKKKPSPKKLSPKKPSPKKASAPPDYRIMPHCAIQKRAVSGKFYYVPKKRFVPASWRLKRTACQKKQKK